MLGTQQIVVEDANKSFRNNTNSDFSVRLPEPLNFDSVYELALLDVSIPCTVHNVKNENYFDLVFYGKTAGSGVLKEKSGLPISLFNRVCNLYGYQNFKPYDIHSLSTLKAKN